MNKRELIKALFSNPTIKGLYESGDLNDSDITRAILTESLNFIEEAKGEDNKKQQQDRNSALFGLARQLLRYMNAANNYYRQKDFLYNLIEPHEEIVTAVRDYDDENIVPFMIAFIKQYSKEPDSRGVKQLIQFISGGSGPAIVNATKQKEQTQETIANLKKNLPESNTQQTNAASEENQEKFLEYVQELNSIGQNFMQFQEKIEDSSPELEELVVEANSTISKASEFIRQNSKNPHNGVLSDLENFIDDIKQQIDKIKKGVQGNQDGTGTEQITAQEITDSITQIAKNKYSEYFPTWVSETYKRFKDLPLEEEDKKVDDADNEIQRQFKQIYGGNKVLDLQTINDGITAAANTAEEVKRNEITNNLQSLILNNPKDVAILMAAAFKHFEDNETQYNNSIIKSTEDLLKTSSSADEEDKTSAVDQLLTFLGDRKEIKAFLDKNDDFKQALAVAYVEATKAKKDEQSTTQESINRDLSGIFLAENTEEGGQQTNPTDDQAGPVDVTGVQNMLGQLDQLFKAEGLEIDVQAIFNSSKKDDSTNVDQEQEKALQQKADAEKDKDLSSMEQEELDESWKTTLDNFFGKSTESSSFMNQLLLRKQSDLLYGMIKTLDQIIVGSRKPKTGGGTEAASITDVGDEEDNKETQTQEDPNTDSPTPAASGKRDDSMEEQIINEVFDSLFGGKKDQDETVQLSRQSTKNMRQHLEAMVTLLRSLKEDINDYSQFATRESADPRFDGSSLKKAMDAKLAVTQKRIAMLTKQIEISVADQDEQVNQFAEHLAEDKKSERRLKVQKVREVYNEMRRLYINGLMVDLENGKVKKAKRSAQVMKDYILSQEEFLSYFPRGMVVGTSVMTLSEAHESMSQIIKKFIDTIRDVVTITKSQEVSKEQLEVAAADLVQIADRIEALFKVPSQIDKEFMKKYVKIASQSSKSGSLTDEKPSSGDDMLEFVKNWFTDKFGELANTGLESLIKLLANGFKGKNISPEQREKIMQSAAQAMMWFNTLEDNEQQALIIYAKYLLDNEAVLSENEDSTEKFYNAMNTIGIKFKDGRDATEAFKAAYEAVKNKNDVMANAINSIIKSDRVNLVKFFKFVILNPDLAKEILALEALPATDFEISDDEDTGDDSKKGEETEETRPPRSVILDPLLLKVLTPQAKRIFGTNSLEEKMARSFFALAVINSIFNNEPKEPKETQEDVNRMYSTLRQIRLKDGLQEDIINFHREAMKKKETQLGKFARKASDTLVNKKPDKLLKFFNMLIDNAEKLKEQDNFVYNNAGDMIAIERDVIKLTSAVKDKKSNLAESLRPVIEKMLKEYRNQ